MIYAERFHDFSCAHRAVLDTGPCNNIHGHNYRVHFGVINNAGMVKSRVFDFSLIKTLFCQWLEDNWDHRFLIWEKDPVWVELSKSKHNNDLPYTEALLDRSMRCVPFDTSTENMAEFLLNMLGPIQLRNFPGVVLQEVRIEETRKCGVKVVRERNL